MDTEFHVHDTRCTCRGNRKIAPNWYPGTNLVLLSRGNNSASLCSLNGTRIVGNCAGVTIIDARFSSTPTGLEDVSRYPQLLATLLEDPTWTEDDIKKLAGLNLLRVFAKVEQVGWIIFFFLLLLLL